MGLKIHFKQKNVKKKIKQTNLERFGVEYVMQNEEVRSHHRESMKRAHGVEYALQTQEFVDKMKQTNIDRYGVECSVHNPEIWQKAIKTMKESGNYSKLDTYFENLLVENNINYKSQYKEKRYPYHCDFYLPDIDNFIEINGYWTHNDHLFDKTNKDDLEMLEFWKSKEKEGLPQYSVAIYIWTVDDVNKVQCARYNNLNYTILWNEQDINTYIKTLTSAIK